MRRVAVGMLIVIGLAPGLARAAETVSYTYDAQGRVVRVVSTGSTGSTAGPSTTTYQYDKVHNRVRKTVTKP